MRRLLIIAALLVVLPIVEITVLIAVGQRIGAGPTLLLMLATSVLGGWLLRHEGGRAWRVFQADLAAGRPPGGPATDGLLVLLGGVFMLVPGFVSDVVGLLLILPPTRRLARAVVLDAVARRVSPAAATSLFGPRRVRVRYGAPRGSGSAGPTWRPTAPRTQPDRAGPASGPAGPGTGGRPPAIEGEIIEPHERGNG